MRLAFYAPMKPPDDPVPSGDRTLARALVAALESLGAKVDLASRFRSRDGKGDAARQVELLAQAEAEVAAAVAQGRAAGWQAWITYHNYYKAPDLLGPAVSAALGIPYLQVESTRARKRLGGPWDRFARAAEAATDAARVVFHFSERDAEALRSYAPEGQHLMPLAPFLTEDVPPRTGPSGHRLLSVGMMRFGDKLASYQLIADTLTALPDLPWSLTLIGDGPARPEVEVLMRPFAPRLTWAGEMAPQDIRAAMAQADIFLWPGVNEALGMVYLEAQAAGLAVVAQDRPGMRDLLAPGAYPSVAAGPDALAAMLQTYLADPQACAAAGLAARAHVVAHHLMPRAARQLAAGLAQAGVTP